jgi:hypothetical protein
VWPVGYAGRSLWLVRLSTEQEDALVSAYPDDLISTTAKALYEAQVRSDGRSSMTLLQAYRSDAVAVLDALSEIDALRECRAGVVDSST